MIVILTGPSGVGKTDTSWALLQQFDDIVFLDCDWFASRVPFSWEIELDVESVFQALSMVIGFHIDRGTKNFVVPFTIEMAKLYQKFSYYFTKWHLPIKGYRLRCSEKELAKRIKERPRIDWQKDNELKEMVNMQKEYDTLFAENSLFYLLDTTQLTENEVANKLYLLANQ